MGVGAYWLSAMANLLSYTTAALHARKLSVVVSARSA